MYVYVLQLCVQRIVEPIMPTAPATTRRTMGTSTCVSVTMDTLEIPQTTVMVSSARTYTSRTNASHSWRVSANSNELFACRITKQREKLRIHTFVQIHVTGHTIYRSRFNGRVSRHTANT